MKNASQMMKEMASKMKEDIKKTGKCPMCGKEMEAKGVPDDGEDNGKC